VSHFKLKFCNRWKADLLPSGSKFILISTEGGSIQLRTKEEGGGNYAHHGSKAAENMVGKLLSSDFHDKGVTVVMIHVSGLVVQESEKSEGVKIIAWLYEDGHDKGRRL
jgi:hypothetical protein